MARCELTEKEWQAIKPHLPNKPRGVARVDEPITRPQALYAWLKLTNGWSADGTVQHDGAHAAAFALMYEQRF